MIKVEHLAKSFGNLQVLKDISLTINKGEVVTIIGPSGSGKSTLLRCLNLLERPDSGKIFFDGADILDGKVKIEDIRKNACMVFQHFNLFANMTALQNVAYAPRVVNGLNRADAEAKALKLLQMVGLGDKAGQYPSRLSGGQKQRISLARALLKDPSILILDDTTSAVDMETETYIQKQLKNLEGNHTIFIIAYRISSLKDADQILVLDHGRIAERGTHEELLKNNGYYARVFEHQYHTPAKEGR